jgi:hypothetical protein
MKFDAQVGNPPYNPSKDGKKSGHITTNLWSKFVDNAYEHLTDGGHLLYVHPPLWRKPDSDILKRFQNTGNIKCVRIFEQKESKKSLGFPVKVDYYCVQKNVSKNTKTKVIANGKTTDMDISNLPFLPNDQFDLVNKLFTKDPETNVFYNCDYHHYTQNKTGRVSPEKTETHIHKVLYLSSNAGYVYHYANTKLSPHFDCPKIIIPMGHFSPLLDLKGEVGMCEVAFAILGEEEYLKNVYAALLTPEFNKVISSCKWKVTQLDYRLFKYLRKDFWKNIL